MAKTPPFTAPLRLPDCIPPAIKPPAKMTAAACPPCNAAPPVNQPDVAPLVMIVIIINQYI